MRSAAAPNRLPRRRPDVLWLEQRVEKQSRAEAVIGGAIRGGVAVLALLAGGGALADVVPGSSFDAAGWHGEARTRRSGEFSYCVIRRDYPNGIELSLARSPENLFFLGLKHQGWALEKGQEAEARLAIDAAPDRAETAKVISADTVLFTFHPYAGVDFPGLLSAGKSLSVEALSVVEATGGWQFDLAGAREGLEALQRCVADHSKTATASAPH
jgi:hypothetical protein